MQPLPTPEHLQLLNTAHLSDACAGADRPAEDDPVVKTSAKKARRALVGTALVRNAQFEQRRRTCSVPVRDRYGDAPADA